MECRPTLREFTLPTSNDSKGVLIVIIQRIFTFTAMCLLGLMVLTVNVNSANAQTKVAVVDIGLIFKNHPSFAKELESLKAEADGFKEETRQLQAKLVEEAGALKNYQPDSAEFQQMETGLAQKSAALEVQQRSKLRGLMEREAKLHYDTYLQIKSAISSHCEERGIQLVIRHESAEMDPAQPASIMQKVNSKIVFHRPANEITQQIVARVSQAGGEQRR